MSVSIQKRRCFRVLTALRGIQTKHWPDWFGGPLIFGLETDRYQVEQLDDLVCEFPRLDERYAGLDYRYGYIAGDTQPPNKVGGFNVIAAVDHRTGN